MTDQSPGEQIYLEGLPPQSMRCLRKVLDKGRHQLLQPDQAVDVLPSYVPFQELRLGLLELCYDGAQVPLVQLLEPPHLHTQQQLKTGRKHAYAHVLGTHAACHTAGPALQVIEQLTPRERRMRT